MKILCEVVAAFLFIIGSIFFCPLIGGSGATGENWSLNLGLLLYILGSLLWYPLLVPCSWSHILTGFWIGTFVLANICFFFPTVIWLALVLYPLASLGLMMIALTQVLIDRCSLLWWGYLLGSSGFFIGSIGYLISQNILGFVFFLLGSLCYGIVAVGKFIQSQLPFHDKCDLSFV